MLDRLRNWVRRRIGGRPMPRHGFTQLGSVREAPLSIAHGIGGQLRLYADRIEIHRAGYLLTIIDLILHIEREIETTIFLEDLAAAHVIRSLFLVEYVRFSYPGSPQPSGSYLRDAFSENALMLRWTDNRAFGRLIEQMNLLRAGKSQPRIVIGGNNQRAAPPLV
jgi:hypothetical protein